MKDAGIAEQQEPIKQTRCILAKPQTCPKKQDHFRDYQSF